MVNEIRYTNIRRVLDNLLDHPLLSDLTLEQVVRHTVRFVGLFGFPKMYQDKVEEVEIEQFRGVLPCDLVSIIQVRENQSGLCMRAMTDSFPEGLEEPHRKRLPHHEGPDVHGEIRHPHKEWYIPRRKMHGGEPAFKTQGRIIYTSFPHGIVSISYRAIPVDEDGFPLLIDDEVYLAALEAYIKKQVFTVKFETGKIAAPVLQNAQKDYAFLAGQLQTQFTTPSPSEAEAYSRMYQTLIPRMREFDRAFKSVGDREYLRKH